MKKITKIWSVVVVFLFPIFVSAQTVIGDIDTAAQKFTKLGQLFITLAISFAVIWIIGSVVWYLVKGGSDEEARKKGGQSILYGVIGLFVILSVWGLVAILRNTFVTQDRVPKEEINQISEFPTLPVVR